jgi:ubiquilin
MKVNIQATHDAKIELDLEPAQTILTVKQLISDYEKTKKATELSVSSIRLIFAGKILKDDELVSACGIKEGNTVHMVKSQKKPEVAQTKRPDASTTVPPPAKAPQAEQAQTDVEGYPIMAGVGDFDDPALMAGADQIMQNPEMRRQVMDMISTNPELLRTAMQMNPMFNQMPPEMQQMMLNPEMVRLMMETSAAMRGSSPDFSGTFPTPPSTAAGLPANLQNLVQALQGTTPPASQVSSEPPEIRFASQLQQLSDMGFFDKDENIRALLVTNGNVNAAVERLLSNNF